MLNVVQFGGRASRSEFWWFVLFLSLVWFGCALVDEALYETSKTSRSPVAGAYKVVALVPLLSAAVRRLHDAGLPGWLILLPPTALFGIVFLAFGFVRSLWIARGGALGPDAVDVYVSIGLWLATPVVLTTLIVLSWALVMPSSPAANRYGPPSV